MFRKLRNRLILINLGITSVVILITFAAIYAFSTNSANQRPPISGSITETYSDDFEKIISISIKNEKQAAARDLLITLIVSGVAIEIVVAMVSYFLAEEAIKPVREAYEAQKVFIANASHEIKTPLAAISANLEAADISGNKWISNVEKETVKLTELNNELLSLARTDLVTEKHIQEVDLNKLVESNLKSFESRMDGIKFEVSLEADKLVKINVADFEQILGVLMDNAIKYSDKKINLRLTEHELVVENDGTTISKKDLEHIFERFYQADKTADGVGLGLAIAKVAAERNDWILTAESEKKLTRFCLKF